MRDWLQKRRKEVGLTQADLASKLDITESYLCQIEQGTRQKQMDITLATKLADALGISLMEIIKLEAFETAC